MNLALAFLLELAVVAAYAYWGFGLQANAFVKVLAGIGIPLAVIVLWAFFFAPKAGYRLDMPWLMIGKALIFGGAAVCLYTRDASLGLALGGIIIVHLALAMVWDQK